MKRTIKTVLVANRGEIAVRVMRTCREMGIRTVAVYSDIDRLSPHVRQADIAFHIGAPAASESYLNQAKILDVAQKSGADAIHPGYGFLSENSGFAEAVLAQGLAFIGPGPEAMRLLGHKTSARKLAQSLGVPTVPGTLEPLHSSTDAVSYAKKVGYPVLLKAAGGGGGKGMRVVRKESEMHSAFSTATSEAKSAFGDGSIFLEKYIEQPRHIEIQVLADSHGNALHLGERECSIQRRHQKIVEESPSPVVDKALRTQLVEAALQLIKAGGYVNAGTIEFILDQDHRFYFLEMNTRLQVEHPVTEMRTGIDLVHEQIRVASGEQLSMRQDGITFRGHAIECRIYAEDSLNSFLPSPGEIVHLRAPSGFGIREDRGVEEGSIISPYYDPLIAKLITWGNTRSEALTRMATGLSAYELYGVRNNLDLCRWIVTHPLFSGGEFSTTFLDACFTPDVLERLPDNLLEVMAAAAVHFVQNSNHSIRKFKPQAPASRWRDQLGDTMH